MSRKRPAEAEPSDALHDPELSRLLLEQIQQADEARQSLIQAKHTVHACLPIIDHMQAILGRAHENIQRRLAWITNEQMTLMILQNALDAANQPGCASCKCSLSSEMLFTHQPECSSRAFLHSLTSVAGPSTSLAALLASSIQGVMPGHSLTPLPSPLPPLPQPQPPMPMPPPLMPPPQMPPPLMPPPLMPPPRIPPPLMPRQDTPAQQHAPPVPSTVTLSLGDLQRLLPNLSSQVQILQDLVHPPTQPGASSSAESLQPQMALAGSLAALQSTLSRCLGHGGSVIQGQLHEGELHPAGVAGHNVAVACNPAPVSPAMASGQPPPLSSHTERDATALLLRFSSNHPMLPSVSQPADLQTPSWDLSQQHLPPTAPGSAIPVQANVSATPPGDAHVTALKLAQTRMPVQGLQQGVKPANALAGEGEHSTLAHGPAGAKVGQDGRVQASDSPSARSPEKDSNALRDDDPTLEAPPEEVPPEALPVGQEGYQGEGD